MKSHKDKKTELDELEDLYTEEMQAAARIAAAQPGVDNETREKPRTDLIEKRPNRDY